MDIRRIPGMQELNFIEWLRYYHIPGILVLTKSDKLSKNKQATQRKAIADALGVFKEDTILFSAKSRMGKDDVWNAVEQLLDFEGVT